MATSPNPALIRKLKYYRRKAERLEKDLDRVCIEADATIPVLQAQVQIITKDRDEWKYCSYLLAVMFSLGVIVIEGLIC